MKSRVFYKGILTHCYQRTITGGVLFYSVSDYLVFFTEYCVLARKYNIHVLALCQMPDHVHDSIFTDKKKDLGAFKCELNKRFSRAWNQNAGIKGPVFEGPYGSAPKIGDKKARTNIIYVYDNPVERRIVEKAEKYRWNYLAYCFSDHPFSEKLIIRYSSPNMKRAVKEVKSRFIVGKPVSYPMLHRLFMTLNASEKQQLVDYVITTYNVVDYECAARYFGGRDNMLTAIHSSTGSEYDLNEIFVGKTDKCYYRMTDILLKEMKLNDIHEILSMTNEEKSELFFFLMRKIDAKPEQIGKYLHMDVIHK